MFWSRVTFHQEKVFLLRAFQPDCAGILFAFDIKMWIWKRTGGALPSKKSLVTGSPHYRMQGTFLELAKPWIAAMGAFQACICSLKVCLLKVNIIILLSRHIFNFYSSMLSYIEHNALICKIPISQAMVLAWFPDHIRVFFFFKETN